MTPYDYVFIEYIFFVCISSLKIVFDKYYSFNELEKNIINIVT